MKFILNRFLVHLTTFTCLVIALCFLHTKWQMPHLNVSLTLVTVFALLNGAGEIAFAVLTKKNNKSSMFKIIVIRTLKFLCYLICTLPLILFPDLSKEYKLFYGVLIIVLFFLYCLIEFSYFKTIP